MGIDVDRSTLFIGGEWVPSTGRDFFEVTNPATEQVMGRAPRGTNADMDAAVTAARHAFDHGPWPTMSSSERAEVLSLLHMSLTARTQDIAELVTDEVGTPLMLSSMVQAGAPLMFLDYYVGLARERVDEELRPGLLGPTLVRQAPVGVVAAVVPWNYPFYLAIAKVAPALVAGCTVIVKPSPETPLDAFVLAEAAVEAGLPPGVLNIVPADREAGEHLVRHPGVDKVSFTGSTAAGRRIMGICAESIRRVTLELGGKSACILLEDAPLDTAISMAAQAATINSGQTCVAQTRLLVPRAQRDEVIDRLRAAFGAMVVGDPRDPATTLGPLQSSRQRDRVEGYIEVGRAQGAEIVCGGRRPDTSAGYFIEPTIFVGVDNAMRIAQEEIFGPVVAVIDYETEEDAIALANDSIYGLSGAVWTADNDRGVSLARRIRTGTFAVNGLGMNPAAPFGGFKQSGIGRELGPEGLLPYVEFQSISVPADYQPA
jgi:betaine-aldehyde dehydrogenase